MNASRDPFGFEPRRPSVAGSNPLIVVVQPGQELRIVVPDETSAAPGFAGLTVGSEGSGDSRVSSKGDLGSRVSGKGDLGSRVSGKGDGGGGDPFAFPSPQRGFSTSPLTIIARPGQEIRVIISRVQPGGGEIPPGFSGFSGDSRASGPAHDMR
jgi:hypothetical protein